ncbi:hypothetical protein CRP01_15720 [Flavilitoribacter nigricans DSM 23189 = NBRC 102662]|uniref:Uncharacterized protein n=1 Tax=Flavilitoribacter nigricans (strain ATCC 23147 / DSM 23189 / NBRC 102662 / NCIMB 1420 / SS-2) TaxID=1122177 RepID=A0A2D0NAA6_FLAN2|nr:hypothetical protein CRP01_15720 [Flavilitoribacter nigricans DSM 23189 = NBRC 102662]
MLAGRKKIQFRWFVGVVPVEYRLIVYSGDLFAAYFRRLAQKRLTIGGEIPGAIPKAVPDEN